VTNIYAVALIHLSTFTQLVTHSRIHVYAYQLKFFFCIDDVQVVMEWSASCFCRVYDSLKSPYTFSDCIHLFIPLVYS
jgi:hypothetical protein